jgi:hypothetical protein
MIHLQNLDASIARLDMALLRAEALPSDPLAAYELAFCLHTLASQDLPSGLGAELDDLIGQAMALAQQFAPVAGTDAAQLSYHERATGPARNAIGQLRSKLLDIAAAISVLARD